MSVSKIVRMKSRPCPNCNSFSHIGVDCPWPAPPLGQLVHSPRYRLLGTSAAAHEVARQLASLRDLPARPQGTRRIAEEAGPTR